MVCGINVLFEANGGRASVSAVNRHKIKQKKRNSGTCILLDLRGKCNSFEVVNLFLSKSHSCFTHSIYF